MPRSSSHNVRSLREFGVAMLKHALVGGITVLALGGNALALDINHATEAQLDGLRGLGPSTTQRILQARSDSPFASWDDLMARVKGIKPGTAGKLSAQGVTVQGKSFNAEEK